MLNGLLRWSCTTFERLPLVLPECACIFYSLPSDTILGLELSVLCVSLVRFPIPFFAAPKCFKFLCLCRCFFDSAMSRADVLHLSMAWIDFGSIVDRFWPPKWVPKRSPKGVQTRFLVYTTDTSRKTWFLQAVFLPYQQCADVI